MDILYYHVLRGLRGCYMPDDVAIYSAEKFDDFKNTIKYECIGLEWDVPSDKDLMEAYEYLLIGRDWREVCVATDPDSEGYGIMVSGASEDDYKAAQERED